MPNVTSVEMSSVESEFYALVTEAVKKYAWENDVSDGFLLATPQRQLSSCIYAAAASWNIQDREASQEDNDEEILYEDLGVETEHGQSEGAGISRVRGSDHVVCGICTTQG
jgi:hypothetical protein